MGWIFSAATVAAAIILLWVVSLRRVFSSPSCIPSAPAFLLSGGRRRNVLLVVAHPDDECMFFTPTILFLISVGHNLHILCLSTGNADNKGNVRKEESYQACAVLKVPLKHVKILDHPDLQDGFDKQWDHQLLATIIEEEVEMKGIDSLFTFDKHGVSGHCNHCDVHHGTRMFLQRNFQRNVEAWELISTSIFRKYSGPVDIWLSILQSRYNIRGQLYCLLSNSPRRSYLAMAQHDSQWVWFRKLFVLFSSYSYVNTLRKINYYAISAHR